MEIAVWFRSAWASLVWAKQRILARKYIQDFDVDAYINTHSLVRFLFISHLRVVLSICSLAFVENVPWSWPAVRAVLAKEHNWQNRLQLSPTGICFVIELGRIETSCIWSGRKRMCTLRVQDIWTVALYIGTETSKRLSKHQKYI